MKVLVTVAGKHGATAEIGETIGKALQERGLEVTVTRAGQAGGVEGFEAVVLGSGIYAGTIVKCPSALSSRCPKTSRKLLTREP